MTGKMSITADTVDNQLEIVVEDENGNYKKHFIGLSDNVTYVVEDITSGDVENYKYTLNFNPNMWIPVEADIIDQYFSETEVLWIVQIRIVNITARKRKHNISGALTYPKKQKEYWVKVRVINPLWYNVKI